MSRTKIFLYVLSLILLLVPSITPLSNLNNIAFAEETQNDSKYSDFLSSLSDNQRNALKKLDVEANGLQLDPTIDKESDQPISVIVEFKEKPAEVAVLLSRLEGQEISLSKAKDQVKKSHDQFKQDLSSFNLLYPEANMTVNRWYEKSFNGVSLTLPANKAEVLVNYEGVKAVWSNQELKVSPPVQNDQTQASSSSNLSNSSLTLLGVDKLHNEGLKGKGIKIGVIDTGVDYNHPDLKDAYRGGYDFVDNDDDPMETTYEDWKESGLSEHYWATGSTYYTEHGTHVSGVIVGQGKNKGLYMKGIAPEADLYAYRVLGPYGFGKTDAIIAAFDKVVENEMDVINLSLGLGVNNPISPVSIALNHVVLSGITAVVSAGNTGDDLYSLGSPGTASLALTVGASSVPFSLSTYKGTVSTHERPLDLQEMATGFEQTFSELEGKSFPIIELGYGENSDYRNADVNGKIVLVKRGGNTLNNKMSLAKEHGASALIISNNQEEEGHIPAYYGDGHDYLPTLSLSYNQEFDIGSVLQAESTLTLEKTGQLHRKGDYLADFSSRGPSRINYDIKPEVTAPGMGIMSTVPAYIVNKQETTEYQYAYKRLSGTSMAAPHVTGVSALLLHAKQDLVPSEIRSILMNTADALNDNYSVFEAGAGRINAYEAIHSDVLFQAEDETPMIIKDKEKKVKTMQGSLNFGLQTKNGSTKQEIRTIEVTNDSDENKSFRVSTEFTKASMDGIENDVLLDYDKEFTINGRKKEKFDISLTIPQTADTGFYEGYVRLENRSDSNETYTIPFAAYYTEEGIATFDTSSKAISRETKLFSNSTFLNREVGVQFQLNSPVKSIDFLLTDGKTGEDIGYLGYIDGFYLESGQLYHLPSVFNGKYTPIEYALAQHVFYRQAADGYYQIKMIVESDKGKIFTKTQDIAVDTSNPSYSFDIPSVIEYEEGQDTVNISGHVYDHISDLQNAGMDINQSANKIVNLGQGQFYNVKEDGTFSLDTQSRALSLVALDAAGNGNYSAPKNINIIKKGTPFFVSTPDKDSIKPGESIKVTVKLMNAENFQKALFNFSVFKQQFDIENITLHPESSKHGEVHLQKNISTSSTAHIANITLEALEDQIEINGEIPLIEVTLKAKEFDVEYNNNGSTFFLSSSRYQNRDGITRYVGSNTSTILIDPSYSKVKSVLYAEGLLRSNGTLDRTIDYTSVGADISIQDHQGDMYEATIDQWGRIQATNLPLEEKTMKYVIDLPGHFTTGFEFYIGKQNGEGDIYGEFQNLSIPNLIAGDVNKDDVIDLKDAILIQSHWSTSTRETDINFDGIVNEKDFELVEKNYLTQNPYAENSLKPVEKINGKSLEDIKKELSMN